MLEIDGVTVTLASHPCWEIVDELCDTYTAAVDLVTRPGWYTEGMDASLERKLEKLGKQGDFIHGVLSRADEENMGSLFVEKGADPNSPTSLVFAYGSVMSQISDIRYTRQQR